MHRLRSALGPIAVLVCAAAPSHAHAKETKSATTPLPTIGLHVAIAVEGDKPVRDPAWIAEQVGEAARLFGAFGVHFVQASDARLPASAAHLETRDDRDALAPFAVSAEVNVMVVGSLRDVDDPSRLRMGVHWRDRKAPSKHYVIVAADARKATLAHELGHFFGNGHSTVVDNLMSYERSGADVFLDPGQIQRIRSFAKMYLASKELVAIPAAP
jgi:hypothetical protein